MENSYRHITVVGLGPDVSDMLTKKAYDILTSAKKVVVRTARHCVVDMLISMGIEIVSLDYIYDICEDFELLEQQISDAVIELLNKDDSLIYAVPGHGLTGDGTVALLLKKHSGIDIVPGMPGGYENIAAAGNAADEFGSGAYITVPGSLLMDNHLFSDLPLMITQLNDLLCASDVKLKLAKRYTDDTKVVYVHRGTVKSIYLYELDQQPEIDHTTTVLLPKFSGSGRYGFMDLVEVMHKLRSKDGCPWDREQTHQSLLPFLVEESHEVMEAVLDENYEDLYDELGDVLLQIVFHSRIADEKFIFDEFDVTDAITRKMIRRHPHVFSDNCSDEKNIESVHKAWNEIKAIENAKKAKPRKNVFDGIPKTLPVLQKTAKMQSRASKAGFKFTEYDDIVGGIAEELEELKIDLNNNNIDDGAKEVGDLLFAIVNLCRRLEIDPIYQLHGTNKRFEERIMSMIDFIKENSESLEDLDYAAQRAYWQKAKKDLKH